MQIKHSLSRLALVLVAAVGIASCGKEDPQATAKLEPNQSIALLLNRGSYELTDLRHSSKDGTKRLYDEVCLTNHHTRLVFWNNNKETLVLEYFAVPELAIPGYSRWTLEQSCPSLDDVAGFVARDSNGMATFARNREGRLALTTNFAREAIKPSTGVDTRTSPALHARVYFDSDQKIVSEDIRFIDQTPQRTGSRLADGSYEEFYYFANKNVSRHRIKDRFDVLTQEEVKSSDGQLLSTMVKGVSNTLTTRYDPEKHLPLWVDDNHTDAQLSTITAYYPGTTKVRMKAEYNYLVTNATYLRDDGTIDRVEALNPGNIEMTYKDKTGKVDLYTQLFSYGRLGGKVISEQLLGVKEFDAKGNVTALLKMSDDGVYLAAEERNNVTVNTITFAKADYFYRPDGTLSAIQYIPSTGTNPPLENHTQVENIRSTANLDELKPPVFDDLPIPSIGMYSFFGQ